MSAAPTAGGHWLSDALLRNWGTKAIALVLALVVFVMTRDEVTRTFQVQIDVQSDPDRILRTTLPDSVEVKVRGRWSRMAKLRPADLGRATIKLTAAEPGPLELDPASIVMPEGVVLVNLDYERVDLRFEAIVERSLTVVASLTGEVHADYERVALTITPDRWRVRGPESSIDALTELKTETVSITGATKNMRHRAALIRPAPGVAFVGSISGPAEPVVDVEVEVRPRRGTRELKVELRDILETAVTKRAENWLVQNLPPAEEVRIAGPLPALRQLESVAHPLKVELQLARLRKSRENPGTQASVEARIQLVWDETVPEAVREQLDVKPESLRFDLQLRPVTP